jgi:hypothetical protein
LNISYANKLNRDPKNEVGVIVDENKADISKTATKKKRVAKEWLLFVLFVVISIMIVITYGLILYRIDRSEQNKIMADYQQEQIEYKQNIRYITDKLLSDWVPKKEITEKALVESGKFVDNYNEVIKYDPFFMRNTWFHETNPALYIKFDSGRKYFLRNREYKDLIASWIDRNPKYKDTDPYILIAQLPDIEIPVSPIKPKEHSFLNYHGISESDIVNAVLIVFFVLYGSMLFIRSLVWSIKQIRK